MRLLSLLARPIRLTQRPSLALYRPYASESQPSNTHLVHQLASKSDVIHQLMSDQEAVVLFKKMSTYMEKQGYTPENPPGKMAMVKLIIDPEFRTLMTEMKGVVERLKISPEELQKMQQAGMDFLTGFKK